MTHENVVIIAPNDLNFPQTGKPMLTNQNKGNLWKCLKSNIKCIASIQIMCGVAVLSLGIILVCAPFSPDFSEALTLLLKSAHPFIGALCFIISGSLSAITEQKTTKILVQCSLAINIMSSLSATVGFILLCINLAALSPISSQCLLNSKNKSQEYHYIQETDYCSMSNAILAGTLSVMLICVVLELSLAALSARIWWQQAQSVFPGVSVLASLSTSYQIISVSDFC